MNGIEEFATSFLSLNLHAVSILIWKKMLSLTLFKIITVSWSGTLLRVFLMADQVVPLKEVICGVPQQAKKFELSPTVGYHFHRKLSDSVPWSHSIYWKNRYLLQLWDKFYQKFCLRHAFSVTQSWLIWKSSSELNPLILSSVQQDYLSELYPIIRLNIYGKPWWCGRITPKSQNCTHFPHQKKTQYNNKFTSLVIIIIFI